MLQRQRSWLLAIVALLAVALVGSPARAATTSTQSFKDALSWAPSDAIGVIAADVAALRKWPLWQLALSQARPALHGRFGGNDEGPEPVAMA